MNNCGVTGTEQCNFFFLQMKFKCFYVECELQLLQLSEMGDLRNRDPVFLQP